jgi:F-type H+-transporting ATPase subunit a
VTLLTLLSLSAIGYLLAEEKHPAQAPAIPHQGETESHSASAHKPDAVEHVMDQHVWELFPSLAGRRLLGIPLDKWKLPTIRVGNYTLLRISKFMILELVAAGLIVLLYVPLARRLQSGEPPRGAWANILEVLLTFIRDQVARPNIGEHDADRYVPFLWTMFLFILFNNLFGLVPLGGSPTASTSVTIALAICAFFAIHGSAIAKMGFLHYLKSLWPQIDVPFPLGYVIKPVVCVIEIVGVLVRNGVLAVRLFANMFAGHVVLATILIFIYTAASLTVGLWATITVSSILGMVALNLLELFIAFLQAFIFVFLTSLFMGMAMHPAH